MTVDLDADIVEGARAHLAAAGVDGVEVVCGDGGLGHPARAPYDRIIVTVGAWDIVPAWWEQLTAGGRLVAPLSLRGVQRCVALERHDGWLESVSVCDCGFMGLRGGFRGPETVVSAGAVTVTFDSEVDAFGFTEPLTRPGDARELPLSITREEIFGGLVLWLALHEPGYCTLDTVWPRDGDAPVPVAVTFPSGEVIVGWSPASFDGASLALLAHTDDRLAVHAYGNPSRAARFADAITRWDARGRPSTQSLKLRVHPASEPVGDTTGLINIHKRWSTLVIDWPGS